MIKLKTIFGDKDKAKPEADVAEKISDTEKPSKEIIVDKIYRLRRNFVIIGLTGRTGSGCTTVAETLSKNFKDLKSLYREFNSGEITNDTRKNRIVYRYLQENWDTPFTVISASDVIFYFALQLSFDEFVEAIVRANSDKLMSDPKTRIDTLKNQLAPIEKNFNALHQRILSVDIRLDELKSNPNEGAIDDLKSIITKDIRAFRNELKEQMDTPTQIDTGLQQWGNNIRIYDTVLKKADEEWRAPSCLAHKINQI